MKSFKPLLQLGGSTVIRTAIETLQSAGVSPIVVVTGREADALQRHLQSLAVHCIYNKILSTTDMFHSEK
jgi:choline kinase